MAASYQTGISSSPTNLLQTLATWLVAQGWTLDASASENTGWRTHLHKGSQYVNFRAAMNEKIWPDEAAGHLDAVVSGGYGIGFYMGDGYSGAAAWHKQSGRPTRMTDLATTGAGMNLPSGSVSAYHFFDDGLDNITVVVEKSPGVYVHLYGGPSYVKTGYAADYWYFGGSSSCYRTTWLGSNPGIPGTDLTADPPMAHSQYEAKPGGGGNGAISCGYVRVDSAVYSGRWIGNSGNDGDKFWCSTGRLLRSALNMTSSDTGLHQGEFPNYKTIKSRIHQVAYAGSMILPMHGFCHTQPQARWAPIGYPPTMFYCDAVGHGYSPSTVYQVGGLNYMIFPGFAVRKAA